MASPLHDAQVSYVSQLARICYGESCVDPIPSLIQEKLGKILGYEEVISSTPITSSTNPTSVTPKTPIPCDSAPIQKQHSTLDLQIDFQKQSDAPEEEILEAVANAAEEGLSNHHQTLDDEPFADPVPDFVDGQTDKVPPPNSVSARSETSLPCFNFIFPSCFDFDRSQSFSFSPRHFVLISDLFPLFPSRSPPSMEPLHLLSDDATLAAAAASSSAMDVSLLDTGPYNPGPFDSHPLNPIKLGFPKSKMDEAYNHANCYAKEEEFCVGVKDSWFKQSKREICLPCSEDSQRKYRPVHYRDISYTKVFKEYPMIDDNGNSFELSFVGYKCLGTGDKNKKDQNQICWVWQKVSSLPFFKQIAPIVILHREMVKTKELVGCESCDSTQTCLSLDLAKKLSGDLESIIRLTVPDIWEVGVATTTSLPNKKKSNSSTSKISEEEYEDRLQDVVQDKFFVSDDKYPQITDSVLTEFGIYEFVASWEVKLVFCEEHKGMKGWYLFSPHMLPLSEHPTLAMIISIARIATTEPWLLLSGITHSFLDLGLTKLWKCKLEAITSVIVLVNGVNQWMKSKNVNFISMVQPFTTLNLIQFFAAMFAFRRVAFLRFPAAAAIDALNTEFDDISPLSYDEPWVLVHTMRLVTGRVDFEVDILNTFHTELLQFYLSKKFVNDPMMGEQMRQQWAIHYNISLNASLREWEWPSTITSDWNPTKSTPVKGKTTLLNGRTLLDTANYNSISATAQTFLLTRKRKKYVLVLHRKMIHRENAQEAKVLIKWKALPLKHDTWKYSSLRTRMLEGEGIVTSFTLCHFTHLAFDGI